MHQRLVAAWLLLVLVGLLLGLLVAVLAVGVSRHVRRQRHRLDRPPPPARHSAPDDGGDEPSSFPRRSADENDPDE